MKKVIPLILIISLVCLLASSCSGEKDSNGNNKTWALATAQEIVSSRLKSPSSAKFSWPDETSVSLSGNTWTVRGWVDAQNGFGASIRSNYAVRFESSAKGSYTVISCSVK